MKHLFFVGFLLSALLLLPSVVLAQDGGADAPAAEEDGKLRYQSLFWKIEHPGFDKPSYLYGTMHVSHKIAFHLNDAFYEALRDVDQIALETNPDDWMEKMIGGSHGNPYGFGRSPYRVFAPKLREKDDLKPFLQMNNQIVNGILYRNNDFQQNFEEETYLDMFIFQAGGKMGKPIRALEDLDEADALVKKAAAEAYDPDRELAPWLKKRLQEKGVGQLLEDAYRDKNLDFIDSLNREYYNEVYNEYMLYERNYNMADAIDTVLRDGNVLIGIGAAHLPGEDGVIEILRGRGYAITPITGELTEKGKEIKTFFEGTFADRPHRDYTSSDGFITLSLPGELHEFSIRGQNVGVGMDITNGAYFLLFRTSTYDAMTRERLGLDDVEGMLYENIPGKILTQERVEVDGFPAIALTNRTKSGEDQRYLIIRTPLEFIVMKLGGKKDYVAKFGDKYFNGIKLGRAGRESEQASPYYGGFQVDMPPQYTISANSKTLSAISPIEIQGVDPETGDYYFAKAITFHDLKYFEEDRFEVEYLHKVFYDELDTVALDIETDTSGIASSISHSETKGGKAIWLKTMKKGTRYFMLGAIGPGRAAAEAYFDTFSFVDYDKADEKFEERTDTSLHYTVWSPVEAPPFTDYRRRSHSKDDTVTDAYKNVVYETPYKEFVEVGYHKYHSYSHLDDLDSVWNNVDKHWKADDGEGYALEVFDAEKGETKEGLPNYSFKVRREGSSRVINLHYILNHGVMYLIQYDSDKSSGPSPFAERFVATFSPKDTLIGRSPLVSKTDLFFENVYSADSLTREQALDSYSYVDFTEKDIPKMIGMIRDFDFEDDELEYKVGLLEALGEMEDPRVYTFLRDLYLGSEYNAAIQLEVVFALASNPTEANYATIISLMEEDIPLASERKIYNTFLPLRDTASWEYSRKIFPALWEYSSIAEYKSWIFELAEILKDAGQIKPKMFKRYRKQLVNELRIEFKRQKTQDIADKAKGSGNSYDSYSYQGNANLLDEYISLLAPYYKEKEVRELFDKVSTLEDPKTRATVQAQLARNGYATNRNIIRELAEDPKARGDLYFILDQFDQLSHFPKEYLNQKDMAESYILSGTPYSTVDSTIFLKEVMVSDGKEDFVIYFFRTMKEKYSYYGDAPDDREGDWGVQYVTYKMEEGKPVQKEVSGDSLFKEMDYEDREEMQELEKKATDEVLYRNRARVVMQRNGYDGY